MAEFFQAKKLGRENATLLPIYFAGLRLLFSRFAVTISVSMQQLHPDRTFHDFQSLKIRRSTHLLYFKILDRQIVNL